MSQSMEPGVGAENFKGSEREPKWRGEKAIKNKKRRSKERPIILFSLTKEIYKPRRDYLFKGEKVQKTTVSIKVASFFMIVLKISLNGKARIMSRFSVIVSKISVIVSRISVIINKRSNPFHRN